MTSGYIRRQFRLVGIDGTTELTRLVPTAASGYSWLTVPARMIEKHGWDKLLAPLCIHVVYSGRRRVGA